MTRLFMIRSVGRFILTAVALISPALWAQVPNYENWYQVEVIIFAQEDSFNSESQPHDPVLTYPKQLRFLQTIEQTVEQTAEQPASQAEMAVPPGNPGQSEGKTAPPAPADGSLPPPGTVPPVAFVPLEQEQRKLDPEANTLRNNKGYRILFHSAWQQPVDADSAAPWVFINGGDTFGEHNELEGSLRIYRSRFLHVDVNLWLSKFLPGQPAVATAAKTANETAADTPAGIKPPLQLPAPPRPPVLEELQPPMAMDTAAVTGMDNTAGMAAPAPAVPQFQVASVDVLKYSNQINPQSLSYIDHPRMGALVLVTPMTGDVSATATPAPDL